MTAPLIITVIILAGLILWIDYRNRHRSEEPEQPFFDSARLQSEVNELHRCMNDLEQLDAMIIDLRLCKPEELHKSFRIEWQGSTKAHSFDFMSTGANSNTAHMIALAEDQREELNADIQSRIADLYSRAQEMEFVTVCRYQNGEHNEAAGDRT